MTVTSIPSAPLKAGLSRRNFMGLMIISGLISFSSKSVFAVIDEIESEERSLSLYNPRTKERFNGIYWGNGIYVTGALEKINRLMRDVRTNDVIQIDTHLLHLISAISIKLKTEKPFHVISGYRSPETNSLLVKSGIGAAKNSYHLKGQAIDIRLPGLRTSALRRAASELEKGGVGHYPRRRFVHIDVGPVRYWNG
jgi:uncharacterized protein YcbK (DUF882 family)